MSNSNWDELVRRAILTLHDKTEKDPEAARAYALVMTEMNALDLRVKALAEREPQASANGQIRIGSRVRGIGRLSGHVYEGTLVELGEVYAKIKTDRDAEIFVDRSSLETTAR